MRLLLHSSFFDPTLSGGIKRNREVLKYLSKYVDEIIFVPTLDDLRRATYDEKFRKIIYHDVKSFGLSMPDKIDDVMNNKHFFLDRLGYDFYFNVLYYRYNVKLAKILGKISADVYYTQHEYPQMVHFLSQISVNKNVGSLIQLNEFSQSLFEDLKRQYKINSSFPLIYRVPKALYDSAFNLATRRRKWKELVNQGKVRFAFSVSEELSELYPFMKGLYTRVLRPANAFDKKLLEERGKGKEDYAVFYARLIPGKGVLEIPKIAEKLGKKVIVMGRFSDKLTEKKFASGRNVEYLGFVSEEKLREIVARAKLLIYPSHVDFFSLVILESLAMGTPVVAYKIPGIRVVYRGLSAVKLVEEWDIEGIVREARKIFSMPQEEYENMMNEEVLMNFLEEHSSWERVALNELEELRKVSSYS